MKQILFGAIIVAVTTFSACADNNQPSGDAATIDSATITPGADVPPTTNVSVQPDTSAPNAVPAPITSEPVNVSSTPANVTAVPVDPNQPGAPMAPQIPPTSSAWSGKPNPPHGEPGHSCAIPVGQPLP